MRQIINLYLGNMEVEFNQPPEILYTYTQDELTNPTIVRNSFSKTITIEGTKKNNQIFGHFWNLERIQDYGTYGGIYFNASKRTPFQLYVNGDIYESGYAKLTEVRRLHNGVEYDIDLYGGLGQFFNGLNESKETGSKLRLCDLDYRGTDNSDSEFDFTVDKNTIYDAWFTDTPSASTSSLYHYINFVPAYNGFPQKDFNTDKVLINAVNAPLDIVTRADKDGKPVTNPRGVYKYHTLDGYIYASLPQKMTEWELGDLRSGYQRPAIRMKEVINACCKYMEKPENGSWTVELDSDFFNENNPYWSESWMTLPTLSEVNYINEEQLTDYHPTISLSRISQDVSRGITKYNVSGLTESPDKVTFSLHYGFNSFNALQNANYLFISQAVKYKYGGFLGIGRKEGVKYYDGAICLRLEAVNELGNVVAATNWAYLTSKRDNDYNWNLASDRTLAFTSGYETDITQYAGYFKRMDNKYYWCVVGEENDSPTDLIFDLELRGKSYSTIRLVSYWKCNGNVDAQQKNNGVLYYYNDVERLTNNPADDKYATGAVAYENLELAYLGAKTVSGGKLLSGKVFGKKDILNTKSSPAEYLISYCKLFNLHFVKSPNENKVSILTRNNFYQGDNVIDLEKYIDRSKDINIKPVSFDKQWYDFKLPMVEGQFAKDYKATTSYDYGVKRVNTGYEFDGAARDLLEGTALRNAIEAVEKSKYYSYVGINDDGKQPWMLEGLKYNLYATNNTDDTIEMTIEPENFVVEGVSDYMKYYDLYPKLQLHQDENKGIDGSNVLVFFNGYQDLIAPNGIPLNYWLSDDLISMVSLGGSSCWLYTNSPTNTFGESIAIKLQRLPKFERYSMQGYNIGYSMDFGEPRLIYCPHYITSEQSTLYYNYWKTYIEDLYDVNDRVLDCYVRLDDKPNPDWLRRFYWFDNSIWRINKIEDWNVSSFETSKIQFIKVQNILNYTTNVTLNKQRIYISADKSYLPISGGNVTFTVTISDNGCWQGDDSFQQYAGTTVSGCGNSTFTITIPASTSGRTMKFNVIGDKGEYGKGVIIRQEMVLFNVAEIGDYFYSNIPSTGGTNQYVVKSSSPWTVTSNQSYCVPQTLYGTGSTDGETIDVVWSENSGFGNRSATLTFTNAYGEVIAVIKAQDGVNYINLNYDASGGTQTILAPYGGTVTVKPTWITVVDNGDGSYDVIAEENTGDDRSGTIIISTSDGDLTIYVNQIGQKIYNDTGLTVNPNILYFDVSGGTQQFTISNPENHRWIISGYSSWITVDRDAGSNSSIINVTADANTSSDGRVSDIYVYDYDKQIRLEVYTEQIGTATTVNLYCSPNIVQIAGSGGTGTTTLFYINRQGDWVRQPETNVQEGIPVFEPIIFTADTEYRSIVNFTVPENPLAVSREITCTIYNSDKSRNTAFTINQGPSNPYLTVTPNILNFNSTGGTATFTVTTNENNWTIDGI